MFVTVWLGILEISTGILSCANAGHEYPVIKRAGGSYELFKEVHGLVLGALDDMVYKDYELKLEKGDSIFVYTDGVTEATDADNRLFGTGRLLDSLNRDKDVTVKGVLDEVLAGIRDFVKNAPQFDDITMMCLYYKGTDENENG